ncbi:F0F1 ATP synthase subunit delta [Thiolapillus brandeum]|uniref:ATP synthase subunit delta n=1 Tax=Thiolapillus brandeum TaxID=1076588 RepID=A0A7U6GGF5_9GAMM|nr:F0F1 ATP synthase subunit delta [Thiolapillus brandeum]BAO43173.1 F-type H+-transporting ATPase subunit delta [Thiolapillus brandeum]
MSQDLTTIARPYAEAVFALANETGKLDEWAETLEFLAAVARDDAVADIIANPAADHDHKAALLLDIGEGRLSEQGQNLVRLLVENDRLAVLPDIASLYQQMKSEHDGAIDVEVVSAYVLKPELEKELAAALKQKLGRKVRITSSKDSSLIGGVKIRAGDMVIDGSVAGALSQLANELGI